MTRLTDPLFALLRFSLHEGRSGLETPRINGVRLDWEQLFALAARHGTVLLSYPGIQHLPPADQPPRKLKLRWVANVVKGSERAVRYHEVVSDLSQLLSRNGLDTLILKGLTIASLYPVPSYREGGDIDIYLFGEAEKANAIASSMGIEVRNTTAKHSTFTFEGVTVENHRRLLDAESLFRREGALYRKMEDMVGEMFSRENSPRTGAGTALELPPQAAALFLAGHTFRHFCCGDINIRHLCDWVVFFEKRAGEINFERLSRQISELGLEKFARTINSFCAEHLGFEPQFFSDAGGTKKSHRLILTMITRYRRAPRVHIPVAGVLRHIFLRNRIYNSYLGPISPSEFLLPELRRYFVWLLKRLRP
jgi:hypothetical protein